MLDADAACFHFDDGCTAVQVGDVNARRRLSLVVLAISSRRWAELRLRGRVRACLQGSGKSLQLGVPRALARIHSHGGAKRDTA